MLHSVFSTTDTVHISNTESLRLVRHAKSWITPFEDVYSSGIYATLVYKDGKTVTTISEGLASTIIWICVKKFASCNRQILELIYLHSECHVLPYNVTKALRCATWTSWIAAVVKDERQRNQQRAEIRCVLIKGDVSLRPQESRNAKHHTTPPLLLVCHWPKQV